MASKTLVTTVAAFLLLTQLSNAQTFYSYSTAFEFLRTNVDARTNGMGDTRIAVTDDANAIFNNASKYIFNTDSAGGAISYKNISNVNWASNSHYYYLNAAGYYLFKEKNAISGGFRYFNLDELERWINGDVSTLQGDEYTVNLNYSRKLSEQFSAGIGLGYLNSNVPVHLSGGRRSLHAEGFAVDISTFYTQEMTTWNKPSNLSFGLSISNIGPKVNYIYDENSFMPMNLGLGGAYKIFLNPDHLLTIACDVNKLLTPTPDTTDIENNGVPDYSEQSVFQSIIHSFSDAPGGFEEEIHEINISYGIEYAFKDDLFVRGGYFYEHPTKGRRQYFTAGAGISYWKFQFDAAYLIPANNIANQLEPVVSFTLSAQI